MTAAPVLPGPGFVKTSLVIREIQPGAPGWRRMYLTRHPDPLGWGPGLNRFSDPSGKAFGVVYLGSSAKVAFVETLLRDAADGRDGDCVLAQAELEARSLATIEPTEVLRLVDLTADGPILMGVPSDVAGARDQTLAQHWSVAFHSHPDRPDGVFYPSRLNEERCIALYDRALGKLTATATPRLMECEIELAAILDNLSVALV
jgi:hypothetical protein